MFRPLLSLLAASGATVVGLVAAWIGIGIHQRATTGLVADFVGSGLVGIGGLLLAAAGATVALHWLGIFTVGAVHALLGALAVLLAPTFGMFSGTLNPVLEISEMLGGVSSDFGAPSAIFYFSGTALVLGTFLAAAALGVRSRLSSRSATKRSQVVAAIVSGPALIGAVLLVVFAGGWFGQQYVTLFQYDLVSAVLLVGATALAGVAGLCLRWSSRGAILSGLVVAIAGTVAILGDRMLPAAVTAQLPVAYGELVLLGFTFLGVAIGGAVRSRTAVPGHTLAL
ncbi:MAG: hypothetical protein ABIR17_01705 [Pseudolysinimonas sp.]|uniref:hypothetical protein n=1 Tax=Pseudolysinimonas sp. TaxID=2680009 RepID=UPI003262F13F